MAKALTFGLKRGPLPPGPDQGASSRPITPLTDQGRPVRSSCDGSGRKGFLYSYMQTLRGDPICLRGHRGVGGLLSTSAVHSQPCKQWSILFLSFISSGPQMEGVANVLPSPPNTENYAVCHFRRWMFRGSRKRDKIQILVISPTCVLF